MLSRLTLTNFKRYREASLQFAPLTVLIGANGSGKSNAIEALWLLSRVVRGVTLDALRRELRDEQGPVRGRLNELGFLGSGTIGFSCDTTDRQWNRYSVEMDVGSENGPVVVDERLEGEGFSAPLFEVVADSGQAGSLTVAYDNFARGGRKPRILCSRGMAVLAQLQTPARFQHGHQKAQTVVPDMASRTARWLSEVTFLGPDPRAMRSYGFATDPEMGPRGENLSGALFNLCRDRRAKERLLEFVRELPEQNIRDIAFVDTPRREVMVQLTETFGDRDLVWDAVALSDGTLRVLAIAAALLSAREQSLLVIEEMDNGVHPTRAKALLQSILSLARDKSLRVLISTHNPALLDALPDEAIPGITFCYRDEEGASRLVRLPDLPDYPNLVAQGRIGTLMTSGILDRFAKHRMADAERIEEGLAWLAAAQPAGGGQS